MTSINNTRFTEFLLHLLELNNLVTLLHTRKQEVLRNPTQQNKDWYKKTAKELKALNDQANLYAEEYYFLNEKLNNSTLEPTFFVLDLTMSPTEKSFNIRIISQYLRKKAPAYETLRKVFPISA